MTSEQPWLHRNDSAMPYQTWTAFPKNAVVEVRNCYDPVSRIAKAGDLWWGYETELGQAGEGVIVRARQVVKNGKPVFRVKAKVIQ